MTNAQPDTVSPSPWPALTIGQAKRVLEWWSASAAFRDLVATDPERAGQEYDLGFNPALVRPLWDHAYHLDPANKERPQHPVVAEYRAYYNKKTRWRDEIKAECASDDPRFKTWRARQIARNSMENGHYDSGIIHAPLAIELSDGCSVGCWFCGVGATRLKENWPYSAENATLWRGALTVLRRKIGAGSKWGFCYWATDPLDNPDYERFAGDFADITGMYPQTTTAQAHKDPERVRALLAVSEAGGCEVNRFSVVSEALLRRIHGEYTADEMTKVEVVTQMQDATVPKANAGSFRAKAKTREAVADLEKEKLKQVMAAARTDCAQPAAQEPTMLPPGTIACVSGFLMNMIKRTVKLISPCRASETWPLGYIVFDERTFSDAADLERVIEDMMATHMPLGISADDPVRLHPGFRLEPVRNGFRVVSDMNGLEFTRPELADYIGSIGDLVCSGDRSAGQIALSGLFRYGVPELNTLGTLGAMFEMGLLVDAMGRIGGGSSHGEAL
ncbi:MAG: radical SAM family RiPP maturation amino acid epimerase [Rhodospirillaceae bacterium]